MKKELSYHRMPITLLINKLKERNISHYMNI